MQRRGEVPRLDQVVSAAAAARPGTSTLARTGQRRSASPRRNFSYLDGVLPDGTTVKLCRLRYGGSAHQWGFAIYRASHDDYQESIFPTGLPVGTCEDALDTACGLCLGRPHRLDLTPAGLTGGTTKPIPLATGDIAAV